MLRYNNLLKKYSRRLRRNMTDAEVALWSRIRGKQLKGYQFYRQKPIGNFIVDFYCPKGNLIVEVDGGQHYSEEGKTKDEGRNNYLQGLGLRILRFSDREVFEDIRGVLEKIWSNLNSSFTNPPYPPLKKGGNGGICKGGIKGRFIFIICLLNFLSPSAVHSDWRENPSIPLPLSTQEYHQQTMNIAGQDLRLTLYSSSLSKKEVSKFYQNRLANSGWRLEDTKLKAAKLSNILGKMFKESLHFTKDNLILNINFLPQRRNDKQAYFSITLGQINPPLPPFYKGGEGGFRGMESSISVYPAAKQIMSNSSKFGQSYGYATGDSIEQVSAFYRDDMPARFNWSLVNEQPIQKSNYEQKSLGQAKLYFSALKFERGEETCLVGISQSEVPGQIDSEIGRTRITVVYPVRDNGSSLKLGNDK